MKNYKILLVDDDVDDQFFFMDAIKSLNKPVECAVANNGIEAIHHLNKIPPPPSLIFLDLNMPKMNGFECLEKIKKLEQYRDIPVVIFSTSSNPKEKERTTRLGAKVFLTKTSNFRKLQKQLDDILKVELKPA
jgi:CheY-like chemotaxis protein